MLTVKDKAKLYFKNYEFSISSPSVRSALLSVSGIKSPYLKEDNELGAIFIHVPKSAGTSLRKSLYGRKSFHIPATRYFIFDPEKFHSYFKFCFVRNPWDRLLSAYRYLYKRCYGDMNHIDHRWSATYLRGHDFESFVNFLENPEFLCKVRRYIHFRDQLDWISEPGSKNIIVDYVGRFETIDKDYEYIAKRLGKIENLPVLRKGDHGKDYRASYTTHMIDIVSNVYRSDIEAFGYTFE